jgi:cytochrome c-type biogenesis protein CcmH/NrfG
VYKKIHDLPSALADFDAALSLNPGIAGSWQNRGLILLQMNRDREALDSFEHAIALSPGNKRTLNALAYARKRLAGSADSRDVQEKD